MKTMRLWVGALLFAGHAAAQSPAWRAEGFVRNEAGEHLPGARIQVADKLLAITNALGFYRVELQTRPAALTAVYLGYHAESVPVDADGINGQPARIDFVLTQHTTALPEVRIGAKRAEVVVREDFQTDILDFDVIGEKVLVLMRSRKKYLARLLDASRRPLAEVELPGQATILHRSCTGVFHVAGAGFAQELVIIEDDRLDTFPRYAPDDFRRLVEPCVLEQEGYYFFRKRDAFNQSVAFWYADPAKQRHPLIEIHCEAGRLEAGAAYGAMLSGTPVVVEPNLPPNWRGQLYDKDFDNERDFYRGDHSLKHLMNLAHSNAQLAHLAWIESLRLDSLYVPLLRLDDSLVLFDHENGVALRFRADSARRFRQQPIRYHRAPGWQKQLLYDTRRGDLYAHFAPGGRHLLRQIDPGTLEPVADYHLPEIGFFPKSLKVRDGFAWFLARPDPNDVNARLYKVNIRQGSSP